MQFFNRLFGNREEPQPTIKFGRYTDSYKEPQQYDAWDLAIEEFERENYLESYDAFFRYLRDEQEDNVKYWRKGNEIHFEIFQGSKKVFGFANKKKFKAEAKVAKANDLNIGFMRFLVEQNFDLKYSRFALDERNDICILFDTYTLDGSPYKLYFALKELATNADKQDDLLLDEFEMLEPVDTFHLNELSDKIKEIKYNFIIREIKAVFKEIDEGKLNADRYPGGIAYLLLNLCYKLDYLTKPEGFMMETLERIHREYFSNDDNNTTKKNSLLRKEFQKLLDRPKAAFFKEMYEVTTTFGITAPVNHDKVVSFIDGELSNMDWYKDNKHFKVALAIPGYIAGYCLFYYAALKPDKDLLHLYFQIVEADYFKQLGFTTNYFDPETGSFDEKGIKKAIRKIVETNKEKFTNLNPNIANLQFDSLPDFAKSYLLMVRNLDLTKSE